MKTTTDDPDADAAIERLASGRLRPEDRDHLPLAVSADVAAGAFSVSTLMWYRLIRENRCPIAVLRIGNRLIRHRTVDILEALGVAG